MYRILDVLFISGVSKFWYKFIVLWNQICQLIAWVLVFGSIDQTPIILLGFQDRSTLLQVKEHSISWLYDFQFSNEKTGSDFLLYFHFTYFMYEFIQCYIEYYIGIQRILYLPYTRLGGWGHPMILLMKTSWCTANQERNSIFTNSVWITWKETKLLSGPLERKPSWNQPGPQPPHGFKPCCVLVPLDLIHCQCHLKACTTVTILIQVGDLKVALLYSHHQTIVHLMIHILCISWSTYCASHDPHCQGQSVGSIVLVQHHMRLNASWKSSAVPFWLKFWSHIVR